MDGITKLLAVEEIRQLKSKYFRGIDQKDRNLLLEIFADDVSLDYRGATTDPRTGVNALPITTASVLRGRESCVQAIMEVVTGGLVSVHHGGVGEITIVSEDKAEAIWPMFDLLRFPPVGPVGEMVGYGYYFESYERVGGNWKLKTLRLTRLRVDFTPN
jgi:hypothetical protein